MNTLENQRYKELIEKIDNLEKKIVDMEHYIQSIESNIIEKNKEWQIDLINKLLKTNASNIEKEKHSYLEFIKPINNFERCLDLLNSFKSLWIHKKEIDFTDFPTNTDPLMKCLKNEFINMTTEMNDITSSIVKLTYLLYQMEKYESLSFGTESDSPTLWFSDFIKTEFNHYLKDDLSDLFDHRYDYIDLLNILFNISDILSHMIHNVFDTANKDHQEFMIEIDQIYFIIDKDILSPLEKGLNEKKIKNYNII